MQATTATDNSTTTMKRLTLGTTVTLKQSHWDRPVAFTVFRVYKNGNVSLRSAEIGNRDRIKITSANCPEFQILPFTR